MYANHQDNKRPKMSESAHQSGSNSSSQGHHQFGQNRGKNYRNKPRYFSPKKNPENGQKPGQPKVEKTIVNYPPVKKLDWNLRECKPKVLVVCYDLELCLGNEASEIYQIGAIASKDDKILINILPEGTIHWGVVKFAGTNVSTEFDRQNGRKYLWHLKKREEIPSTSPKEGWQKFMEWICGLKSKYQCDKIIMAAHGNNDSSVLLNSLSHYGHLETFKENVNAFCDTHDFIRNRVIAAFERLHPGEKFEAHNALADAEALFKILLKVQNDPESTKLNLTSDILKQSVEIANALEVASFKLTKLLQNMPKPSDGVFIVRSLVMAGKLENYIFKNAVKKDDENEESKNDLHENATYIVIDVQFIHSQGLRSEIAEISAQDLNATKEKFFVRMHGHDESYLKSSGFKSGKEGLEEFMQWLCRFKNVVILSYKPYLRQWLGLVNHAYFHGSEKELFKIVNGLCDFKNIVINSQICDGKCENIEKVHKQVFNEVIEPHRSQEVVDSIIRIFNRIQMPIEEISKGNIEDIAKTLENVKKKLDNSLSDDIANGRYYSQGHIGNFRMPAEFLPLSKEV